MCTKQEPSVFLFFSVVGQAIIVGILIVELIMVVVLKFKVLILHVKRNWCL